MSEPRFHLEIANQAVSGWYVDDLERVHSLTHYVPDGRDPTEAIERVQSAVEGIFAMCSLSGLNNSVEAERAFDESAPEMRVLVHDLRRQLKAKREALWTRE